MVFGRNVLHFYAFVWKTNKCSFFSVLTLQNVEVLPCYAWQNCHVLQSAASSRLRLRAFFAWAVYLRGYVRAQLFAKRLRFASTRPRVRHSCVRAPPPAETVRKMPRFANPKGGAVARGTGGAEGEPPRRVCGGGAAAPPSFERCFCQSKALVLMMTISM